jgi:hypothetical protein
LFFLSPQTVTKSDANTVAQFLMLVDGYCTGMNDLPV